VGDFDPATGGGFSSGHPGHLPLIAILDGKAWKIAGIHATTFIIAFAELE